MKKDEIAKKIEQLDNREKLLIELIEEEKQAIKDWLLVYASNPEIVEKKSKEIFLKLNQLKTELNELYFERNILLKYFVEFS